MTRAVLPPRRYSQTFELRHGQQNYIVSIGFFEAGGPAEVFITGTKAGSDVEAVSRDGAILISLALQHGIPLETMKHAITRGGDEKPMSIVGAIIERIEQEASHVS